MLNLKKLHSKLIQYYKTKNSNDIENDDRGMFEFFALNKRDSAIEQGLFE